jgi:16S rRNA (uracil1498-N3)-methyltransferase
VVQKATECGVKKIVPLISARTVKTGLKKERLEKIIKEASEQSGRGMLPALMETMSFSEALEQAKDNEQNFFFDASGSSFADQVLNNNSVGIFVGPEGGWTSDEINLAKEKGCLLASLGQLILRGETAAIIASYFAVYG